MAFDSIHFTTGGLVVLGSTVYLCTVLYGVLLCIQHSSACTHHHANLEALSIDSHETSTDGYWQASAQECKKNQDFALVQEL